VWAGDSADGDKGERSFEMMRQIVFRLVVAVLALGLPMLCWSVEVWDSWVPTGSPRAVLALERSVWVAGDGFVVRWDKSNRSYEVWTGNEGVADASYTSIVQGRGGEMWFGAPGHATRYSAGRWQSYLLPGSCGTHLAVDWLGRIWAAGQDWNDSIVGVFEDNRWDTFHWPEPLWAMKGTREGTLWFAGQSGLCSVGPRGAEYFNYPESAGPWGLKAFAVGPDGVIWGTPGWLIYRFEAEADPPGWTVFGLSEDGCPRFSMYPPYDMCVDEQGVLWFAAEEFTVEETGTAQCGLLRWTPGEGMPEVYGREELASSAISLSVDPVDGSLWIASPRRGLNRLTGGEFHRWDINEEVHYPITTGESDGVGNIWLGTRGAALVGRFSASGGFEWLWEGGYWPGGADVDWPFPPLDPGWPSSIDDLVTVGSDRVWFICGYWGLGCLEGSSITFWNPTNCPISDTFNGRIEVDSSGAVWIGYTAGQPWGCVDRFSQASWDRFSNCEVSVYNVYDIEAAASGEVWFCGPSSHGGPGIPELAGLSVYAEGSWDYFPLFLPPLSASVAYSMDVDHAGVLWLGTDAGLRSFDGESWRAYSAAGSGGPSGPILAVKTDGAGRVWCADGENGAWVFDGSGWTSYRTDDSPLISGRVRSIFFGPDNSIWFATKAGLSRMREFPGEVQLRLETEHGKGPVLRLLLSCSNQIADLNADLFLWAELADGTRVYLPRVSTEEHPIFTRLAIPDGFAVQNVSIYSVDLTDIPRGHYVIKALLTNHGCLASPLSNEAVAEFDW